MKVDIGKAVRLILEEKHVASIPGIGTFRLKVQPARYSADKSKILAPKASVHFSEETSHDHNLVEFLSQHYEISKVKALKFLEVFEQKLTSSLKTRKSVRVKGLGSFSKAKNGRLEFVPIKSISNSIFYGLKSVSAESLMEAKAEDKVVETEVQTTETTTVTERSNLGSKPLYSEEEEEESYATIIQQSQEKKSFEPVSAKVQKMDENYSDNYDTPNKWFFLLRPLLFLLAFIVLCIYCCQKCSEYIVADIDEDTALHGSSDTEGIDTLMLHEDDITNEDDIMEEDDTIVDEAGSSGEEVEVSVEETEQTGSNIKNPSRQDTGSILKNSIENDQHDTDVVMYEDLDYQPTSCIIVTGSFKNPNNAHRLQKKMEEMGYDTYAASAKGFTRVGFFFDCEDEDLREYIRSIRANLAEDAWYLSPRIHVE